MPTPTPTTTTIRSGAQRVEIYNSGLEVWLYDEANLGRIVRGGAVAKLLAEGEEAAEKELRALSKSGTLVAYALRQDDSLGIDVVVGPALTAKERKVARWLAPQKAFISLPSGRLRVESNDSSRLNGEDPTDEGATVVVPAGDYLLTLHRIDWDAMRRDGLADAYAGAHEVITLTAGAAAKPRRGAPWLLPFEPSVPTVPAEWTHEGGVVTAFAAYGDFQDTLAVNVGAAALEALGVEPGSYLRVTTAEPPISFVAVYDTSIQAAASRLKPRGVSRAEYGRAALGNVSGLAEPALVCRRDKCELSVPESLHGRWVPARVERVNAEPDDASEASPARPGNLAATECLTGSSILWTLGWYAEAAKLPGALMPNLVRVVDEELAAEGYAPLGDIACDYPLNGELREITMRFWGGPDAGTYALFGGTPGIAFHGVITALADGSFLATGTLGDNTTRPAQGRRPKLVSRRSFERLAQQVRAQREAAKELGGPAPDAAAPSLDAATRACAAVMGMPAVE